MSEEEQSPDIFCPVCDRKYVQSEHNGKAYQFLKRHIQYQHPDYSNTEEFE